MQVSLSLLSVAGCFTVGLLQGASAWSSALEDGTVHFDVRLRFEDADTADLAGSESLTLRTRLGFETAPVEGLSGLVEFEAIRQLNAAEDANLAGQNDTGVPRVGISDPEATEINRAWVRWAEAGGALKLGRQRIILEDSRFVGNVGWRQNEQTFDAVRFTLGEPASAWSADYVYVDRVQRIFGDDAPGGADFRAETHLIHGSYSIDARWKIAAFAYLQDLATVEGAPFDGSNDTVGLRLTGSLPLNASWKFSYAASYAHQRDNGGNPATSEFDLGYFSVATKLSAGAGSLGVGWERLEGNGTRMFTTPLATVHGFNGWADVFLGASIGGGLGSGLDDFYLDGSYKVPLGGGLLVRAVYHWFTPENGAGSYGRELDLLAVYALSERLDLVAKYADFSTETASLVDTRKCFVQLDFEY